jgi:hypothetical protein
MSARDPFLLLVTCCAACDADTQSEFAAAKSESKSAAATAGIAPPWFEDVTDTSGLDFVHVRALTQRFWFPEIMGSGAAWLDYDGDGRLDLYCVQSGDLEPAGKLVPGNQLYRNHGDGTFEDVTAKAGVGHTGYGMGATVGDYDGDGDVDLYVTNVGANVLYQNQGDGTFRDVTATANVGDAGWGTSCGFFDYDADGDLDLFVVNYVRWEKGREIECKSEYGKRDYCAPNNFNAPSPSVLYQNRGDGTFAQAGADAGLGAAFGNGLGLALVDFDRDGKPDAYVANDGMPNQLWIHQGEGRFTDAALLGGVAVNCNGASEASMGTVPADLDQNGFVDLFITNLRGETNTVYLNMGQRFVDRTSRSGLALASRRFTGFGDGAFDFDLDGRLDLYVCNGRVGSWAAPFREDDIYAEPNQLFRGIGNARFEEVQPPGGLSTSAVGTSRGAAFADFDDDGDIDLYIVENNARGRLLRNVAARQGTWIGLRLLDEKGRDVPCASAALRSGTTTSYRDVAVCSSYCSANDARLHFALRRGTRADDVVVTWVGGARESFGPLAAEHYHELRKGSGRAESAAAR